MQEFSEDTWKKLSEKSKQLNMDVNELITKAVDYYIHVTEMNRLRPILKERAKQANIKNEDDLFNAIS